MRLTREALIKVAREAASQRARVSRRIICIYLTGSVLNDSPLLGGTTDIDLFIVHDTDPAREREILRMTDEVSLDITHLSQALFHQPRHLRTHPWLGPSLYAKPLVLYDTQHWFDFAQAATGAQFFQPDYVYQRASTLAKEARQGWMHLQMNQEENFSRRIYRYLKVIENAGNALVCLTGEGGPLAERRFFLQLPVRLLALHQPALTSDLAGLFTTEIEEIVSQQEEWLAAWKEAYLAAGRLDDFPPRLDAARQTYYERAATALWTENPAAALWPIIRTWTLAVSHLPDEVPHLQRWQSAIERLNLEPAKFDSRMSALDLYLDRVDDALDDWARANGASTISES